MSYYALIYLDVLHITAKHLRVGFISNDRHPFQFFFSYTRSKMIMVESRCPVLQVYINIIATTPGELYWIYLTSSRGLHRAGTHKERFLFARPGGN